MQNDEYVRIDSVKTYNEGIQKTEKLDDLKRGRVSDYVMGSVFGLAGVGGGGGLALDILASPTGNSYADWTVVGVLVGCGILNSIKIKRDSKKAIELEGELAELISTPEYKEGKQKLEKILK